MMDANDDRAVLASSLLLSSPLLRTSRESELIVQERRCGTLLGWHNLPALAKVQVQRRFDDHCSGLAVDLAVVAAAAVEVVVAETATSVERALQQPWVQHKGPCQ
jgi:hypothetical protein